VISRFLRTAKTQTWTRIKPSSLHGVGVFAIKRIPPDTNIFPECEDFFSAESVSHLDELDPAVQKMCKDYFYHDETQIFLPWNRTLNQINISFLLNYSDNPNCLHHPDGMIYSLRWIEIDEELTHSYE